MDKEREGGDDGEDDVVLPNTIKKNSQLKPTLPIVVISVLFLIGLSHLHNENSLQKNHIFALESRIIDQNQRLQRVSMEYAALSHKSGQQYQLLQEASVFIKEQAAKIKELTEELEGSRVSF